jgi:hypothetical protein
MKNLVPFIFSLFFSLSLTAQDTTIVQIFTWDDDARSGWFTFPDNPDETYRKIWMRYNMRCHDDAVGNGNVGCREWDYSCNTFLTDTTRRDSTRLTHPSHTISNFSGDEFAYSNIPTWSYTQYDQHNTSLFGLNTTDTQVGAGTEAILLADNQTVGRNQFLYTASELQSAGLTAGDIFGLKLDVSQWAGSLDFLRIRMKATSSTELSAAKPETEGFETVYFANTGLSGTGWKDFNFYTPFNWDGSSSLIIDISFSNPLASGNVSLQGENAGFTAALSSNKVDYHLEFNGAGNIKVPTEAMAGISTETTVSLWAYGNPDALPVNTTVFNGVDADNRRQFNVHLPWGNSNSYWDCGDDGSGYDRISKVHGSDSEFKGQWNHWAFTKNTATGSMKAYLNGQLWHSGTGKDNLIQEVTQFVIASAVGGGNPWYGKVDEFRLWDKELDETTIQSWMRRPVDASHPDYDNLIVYYSMDEGAGFTLEDDFNPNNEAIISLPNWKYTRGQELNKNFTESSIRPNITLLQGDYTINDQVVQVIDSTTNPVHQVIQFGLDGTDLVALDTQFLYPAGYMYVQDEAGNIIDSVYTQEEGSISINELTYYSKANAKYELLSLVTPYGNGLDLGSGGKTFVFDVTDYAPILKGDKFLSIEMGGQNQEELDIQFIYITGTPEREVINIQNIWPFRRGWIDQILDDRFFEPREVPLNPDASHYKIRTAITGHGQNGEFVSREHYVNINGGSKDFEFDVWKYCGKNPIYPQGGTWIFDRSGWCPGMATDVHHLPLDGLASPGETITIDYGVNGSTMSEANYLVSAQLVTYGEYNFDTDASIESVIRPNNWRVEYERINPACNTPTILVRNSGGNAITSMEIEYEVLGGDVLTYEWTGNLAPSDQTEIELPLNSTGFWEVPDGPNIFQASILSVNGGIDENPDNNRLQSPFEKARVFDFDDPLELYLRTNLRAFENSYIIRDADGNIVFSRGDFDNETVYEEELDLPSGCYTFEFEDTGNDGLEFWFFPNNGVGSLRFTRRINENIAVPMYTFDPDFGGGVQFDFVRTEPVGTEDLDHYRFFSIYPNPSSGMVNLELHGYADKDFRVQVIDLSGKVLFSDAFKASSNEKLIHSLNLQHLQQGMYFLKLSNQNRSWVKEVVITE